MISSWRGTTRLGAIAVSVLVSALVAPRHAAADPDALWRFIHLRSDALWHLVHNACVPAQARIHNPAPCRYVSPQDGRLEGYAIIKDRLGSRQYLLVPTSRVTGIESPVLLEPGSSGYWAAAWESTSYLETLLDNKVPRDGLGIAVNSVLGRTQHQLHFHIQCVRPDVRAALKAAEKSIRQSWSTIALPPLGHVYNVRKLLGTDLVGKNVFQMVADQGPDYAGTMAIQTIVVVGAVFRDGRDGFYILNDHVDIARRDQASGEELLDRNCTLLDAPSAKPVSDRQK
jgi:CDP-diacylglycerol pyrophosphatase